MASLHLGGTFSVASPPPGRSGQAGAVSDLHDELITLEDGRRVALSPVSRQDSEAIRAFFEALSLESRYHRFHFGLRDLSAEKSREMTDVDQVRHIALVARPVDSLGMVGVPIVAEARYVRCADSVDAEFAIAVAEAWQGAGLGRALVMHLRARAKVQGLKQLFGHVLWGNSSMLALVRSVQGQLSRTKGDATVVRAEIKLEELAAEEVRH